MAEISIFLYYFLVSIFSSFIIRWMIIKNPSLNSTKQIRHPPSPLTLPIIGHLHLLSSPITKSFQTLANRYGGLMRLSLASSTAVIVSSASVAHEILKENEMNFVSRPDLGTSNSDHHIYFGFEFAFAQYGSYWRFLKKLCMSQLLSVRQVNSFMDVRRQETMKFLEVVLNCAEGGKTCDLRSEILTLTNNVICSMSMSTTTKTCGNGNDQSKMLLEFVKEAEELLMKFGLGKMFGPIIEKLDLLGYGKRLKILLNKFDSFIENIMVEHENNINSGKKGERKDIMDILLEVYKDENAEIKLSRTAIKSFFLDMFMAGTSTTGAIIQWTMAELINHPKVFNKLRDEIINVVGSNRLVRESDVPNLPYLHAVIKESLRLHASAPLIFRRCEKDCKINGYDILANERIIFNLRAIMMDPNVWEHPQEFFPERFIMENYSINQLNYDYYQMDMKGRDFTFLPFGSGRRGCPGVSLAMAVIYQVVGAVVQCFDFQVRPAGAGVRAAGETKIIMEEGRGFSGGMAYPLVLYPITYINPLQVD